MDSARDEEPRWMWCDQVTGENYETPHRKNGKFLEYSGDMIMVMMMVMLMLLLSSR